jgi:hypothetical protein
MVSRSCVVAVADPTVAFLQLIVGGVISAELLGRIVHEWNRTIVWLT